MNESECNCLYASINEDCPTHGHRDNFTTPVEYETYKALDELLEAIGRLPLNQVTTRPPLQKAYVQGCEIIDRAVKEGRYVV